MSDDPPVLPGSPRVLTAAWAAALATVFLVIQPRSVVRGDLVSPRTALVEITIADERFTVPEGCLFGRSRRRGPRDGFKFWFVLPEMRGRVAAHAAVFETGGSNKLVTATLSITSKLDDNLQAARLAGILAQVGARPAGAYQVSIPDLQPEGLRRVDSWSADVETGLWLVCYAATSQGWCRIPTAGQQPDCDRAPLNCPVSGKVALVVRSCTKILFACFQAPACLRFQRTYLLRSHVSDAL